MKFGKRLELLALPKYSGHYIQYSELKRALKVWTGVEKDQATVQEVTHWASSFLRMGPNPEVSPEMRLNAMLRHEMERVSKFAELEESGLRQQLSRLEEDVKKRQGAAEGDWNALAKRLDELCEQIVQLKAFGSLNFSGFRKILKKYDKWSAGKAVSPWFMAEVVRAPFMRVGYTYLLAQVNRLGKALRKAGAFEGQLHRSSSGVFDASLHPSKEVVFLIDPSDTMQVRVLLARNLNMKGLMDTAPERPRTCSVYLDTPDMSVYNAHLSDSTSADDEANAAPASLPCGSIHVRHCGSMAAAVVVEMPGSARREVAMKCDEVQKLLRGSLPSTGGLPAQNAARPGAGGRPGGARDLAGGGQAGHGAGILRPKCFPGRFRHLHRRVG